MHHYMDEMEKEKMYRKGHTSNKVPVDPANCVQYCSELQLMTGLKEMEMNCMIQQLTLKGGVRAPDLQPRILLGKKLLMQKPFSHYCSSVSIEIGNETVDSFFGKVIQLLMFIQQLF